LYTDVVLAVIAKLQQISGWNTVYNYSKFKWSPPSSKSVVYLATRLVTTQVEGFIESSNLVVTVIQLLHDVTYPSPSNS